MVDAVDLLPGYLKAWRKRAGMTQVELADRLGVTQGAITRWERGARAISLDQLSDLAALYNVPLTAMLRHPDEVSVDELLAGHSPETRHHVARIVAAYLSAAGKK